MHRWLAKLGRPLLLSYLYRLPSCSSNPFHVSSPLLLRSNNPTTETIGPSTFRFHFSPAFLAWQYRHFATKKEKRSRAPDTPVTSKVKKYKLKAYSSFKFRFWTMSDGQIRRGRAGKRHNAHLKTRAVKVSNVSHNATEQEIKEFFSFSGDIDHVELQSFDEWSRVAYVTFRDSQGAETALLLSGATIVDQAVIITAATDYHPPRTVSLPPAYEDSKSTTSTKSVAGKAEDVVTTMLAKGYVLGKGTIGKAKSFDEKHRITSTAAAKVVSLDRKIGLSEKLSAGASAVNGKVREVDERFQVSGKTKSAFSAAEHKVSSAGSAMLKNKYIFTGVAAVAGAFGKVGRAASDMGSKTKAKVMAEQMKKGVF